MFCVVPVDVSFFFGRSHALRERHLATACLNWTTSCAVFPTSYGEATCWKESFSEDCPKRDSVVLQKLSRSVDCVPCQHGAQLSQELRLFMQATCTLAVAQKSVSLCVCVGGAWVRLPLVLCEIGSFLSPSFAEVCDGKCGNPIRGSDPYRSFPAFQPRHDNTERELEHCLVCRTSGSSMTTRSRCCCFLLDRNLVLGQPWLSCG